jgi:hypothetical protein
MFATIIELQLELQEFSACKEQITRFLSLISMFLCSNIAWETCESSNYWNLVSYFVAGLFPLFQACRQLEAES